MSDSIAKTEQPAAEKADPSPSVKPTSRKKRRRKSADATASVKLPALTDSETDKQASKTNGTPALGADKTDQQYVDWARLEKTASGNQQLMTELLEVFLRECLKLRDALRQSVPQNEMKATRLAAHTLKGAALAIGAIPLREDTAILENKARDQNLDGASEDLESIELVLDKTMQIVERGREK